MPKPKNEANLEYPALPGETGGQASFDHFLKEEAEPQPEPAAEIPTEIPVRVIPAEQSAAIGEANLEEARRKLDLQDNAGHASPFLARRRLAEQRDKTFLTDDQRDKTLTPKTTGRKPSSRRIPVRGPLAEQADTNGPGREVENELGARPLPELTDEQVVFGAEQSRAMFERLATEQRDRRLEEAQRLDDSEITSTDTRN